MLSASSTIFFSLFLTLLDIDIILFTFRRNTRWSFIILFVWLAALLLSRLLWSAWVLVSIFVLVIHFFVFFFPIFHISICKKLFIYGVFWFFWFTIIFIIIVCCGQNFKRDAVVYSKCFSIVLLFMTTFWYRFECLI